MSPDINARKELIDQCKDIKSSNPLFQGLDDDKIIKDIDSILVQPTSLFYEGFISKLPHQDKIVNITIKSKN